MKYLAIMLFVAHFRLGRISVMYPGRFRFAQMREARNVRWDVILINGMDNLAEQVSAAVHCSSLIVADALVSPGTTAWVIGHVAGEFYIYTDNREYFEFFKRFGMEAIENV